MSLECAGCSFRINVVAPNARRCDESISKIPEVYKHTEGNRTEDAKQAFLDAMKEFADSPHFEKLIYDLYNEFKIQVTHSVITKMPG